MLDQITITLEISLIKHDILIDVGHSSLTEKWLNYLTNY